MLMVWVPYWNMVCRLFNLETLNIYINSEKACIVKKSVQFKLKLTFLKIIWPRNPPQLPDKDINLKFLSSA